MTGVMWWWEWYRGDGDEGGVRMKWRGDRDAGDEVVVGAGGGAAAAAAMVEGEGDVGGCRRRRWGPTAATGEGHDGGLKVIRMCG
ncbi:hypothetical protein Tco_0702585 [Tanacetum coccineum]|uniref:Uncharacterized protein n=1 Tax=Tanacetum coccineum TaxID=301880 RepID=A0ABQ4XWE9_9ASTR